MNILTIATTLAITTSVVAHKQEQQDQKCNINYCLDCSHCAQITEQTRDQKYDELQKELQNLKKEIIIIRQQLQNKPTQTTEQQDQKCNINYCLDCSHCAQITEQTRDQKYDELQKELQNLKKEIIIIRQQLQNKPTQTTEQQDQKNNKLQQQTHEPNLQIATAPLWLDTLTWYASIIVIIFTALIAIFSIYAAILSVLFRKEAKEELSEIKKARKEEFEKIEKAREKIDELSKEIYERIDVINQIKNITSEKVADNPTKSERIVREAEKDILGFINRVRLEAIELQNKQQYKEAKEKWLDIAKLTDDEDTEAKARAYFSAARLMGKYDNQYKKRDKDTINEIKNLSNKAIELKPDYAEAFNSRGNAKYASGDDIQGAIADYNQAIELKPNYPKPFYNRGNAKYASGDLQGAIADYNQAIELKPKYQKAFLSRGSAKRLSGDLQGAIADYDKAIELKPEYPGTFNNRGIAKSKLGKYKMALADIRQAQKLKPTEPNFIHSEGEIYNDMSDHNKAIDAFSRAINLDSSFVQAYIDRAKTYELTGNTDAAINDYKKVLELEPDNKEAKQALTKLQGDSR